MGDTVKLLARIIAEAGETIIPDDVWEAAWERGDTRDGLTGGRARAALTFLRNLGWVETPIDMILYCPGCGLQHVDAPDRRTPDWENPPHKSHLCHGCGHIWRPADVPTNGVAAIKTKGKADASNIGRCVVAREPLAEGRDHLTITGTFQSDKYPWCAAGFVPLKITDKTAHDLLRTYADRRALIDAEFGRDLHEALDNVGADRRQVFADMAWAEVIPEGGSVLLPSGDKIVISDAPIEKVEALFINDEPVRMGDGS